MSDYPGPDPQRPDAAVPPPEQPPAGPRPGPYSGQPAGQPGGQPGAPVPPPPPYQPPHEQPGYPPPGQQPGYLPPGYPPPGYYPPQPALPNHPQATLALALGIIGLAGGLFFCGVPLLVSPFAWVTGHRALREIRSAPGRLSGESAAQAGMVLGIIGTVLLVVWLILVVLLVVGLAASNFHFQTGSTGSNV